MSNLPARYQTGELLNLRLPGLRYDEPRHGGHRLVGDTADGEPYEIVLPAGARYELERVAPAEWPPIAGDIWADASDGEWSAVNRGGRTDRVELILTDNDDSGYCSTGYVAEQYGPMQLRYRRGWSPSPEAAEPEPAEPVEVDDRAAYVAGLLEFASFIECRTDLPLPNDTLHFQHTVLGWTPEGGPVDEATRIVEVRRIADLLGVDVDKHLSARYTLPGGAEYVAHTFRDKTAPEPAEKPASDALDRHIEAAQ